MLVLEQFEPPNPKAFPWVDWEEGTWRQHSCGRSTRKQVRPMKPMLCTYRSSAPPGRVWAVASDFEHAGDNIQAIQKVEIVTPGPIGAGTVIRETRGAPGRRGTTIDMTLVAWSPPRSYSLRGSAAGFEFTSEVRCLPDGDGGTRIEMEVVGRPTNLAAKLLSPLFAVMSRMMVKQCAKDLADIAAAAERAGSAKRASGT